MATKATKSTGAAKSGGRFARRENSSLVLVARPKLTVRQGWNPRTVIESAELDDLAQSIVSRGMLTPLLVVATTGGYELVAGHRRVAAVDHAIADGRLPKNTTLPAFLRDRESELADAVAENFNRVDLNPLEEALAFGRMRDDMGLTAKGIAEQIGVAQRRVTERLRILELPASVQPHYGDGTLPAATVSVLLDMAKVSAQLAERAVAVVLDPAGHGHYNLSASALLPNAQAWARQQLLRAIASKWPKDYVDVDGAYVYADRLPWKGKPEISSKVGQLAKDTYSTSVYIELTKANQDAIKASGTVYDGLCVAPDVVEAIVEKKVIAKHKALATRTASDKEKAGLTPSKAEREDERAREYIEQTTARAWNLKLGEALVKKFATIEVSADMVDLLAAIPELDKQRSSSMSADDTGAQLVLAGLRYVLPQMQTESIVKTTGRTKVAYVGGSRDRDAAREAFWRWYELAGTPQEKAGRLLIALAACMYADDKAIPASQRWQGPWGWRDVAKTTAGKLIKKIAGGVVPPKSAAPRAPRAAKKTTTEAAGDEPAAAAAAPRSETRAAKVRRLIREKPGITIPELAEAMGIKQNYLYRLLPDLERDGTIRKEGRGWHPVGADPERARSTELSALQVRVLRALVDATPKRGQGVAKAIRATVNAKLEAVEEAIEQLRDLGLVASNGGASAPYVTKQGGEVIDALDAKKAA